MKSMADLVRVWATADHFEAELLRGRLEADEISVLLKGDGEGPYRAGPVYLFVSSEDEIRARALLDAIASGAFATSDEDVDEAVDEPVEPETSS
jgi:Putative prokaryotic signal transducing protein